MDRIGLKAFAKINLTLDVLGKRADGYHEVAMIMQGIDLHDTVWIEKRADRGVVLTCDHPDLAADSTNLVYRAAELILSRFPRICGAALHLYKRIPIAAGLGGGSSDAAAVLLGMNALFGLKISWETLLDYAAQLGSDVPFCLKPMISLATGRGEIIQELSCGPSLWILLAKPPFTISTPKIYNHLHKVTVATRPCLDEALYALEKKDNALLYGAMANVLEFPAFDLYPDLQKWAGEIEGLGADKVMMSGSGPTLMGFFKKEEDAKKAALLWNRPSWNVFITRTIGLRDIDGRMMEDGQQGAFYSG